MKKASKLTDAERCEIDILHSKGYSARSIAKALGRSPNTVANELKRNSYRDGRYVATRAKQKAYVRRKYAKYQGKKIQESDELRSFIIQKLTDEIVANLIGIPVCLRPRYRWHGRTARLRQATAGRLRQDNCHDDGEANSHATPGQARYAR